MKKFATVAVLFAVALAVGAAAPAAEEDSILVQPKEGGWEVDELIRTITEYTGESILYDPQSPIVRGRKIQFSGTVQLPKEDLFGWFRAQLFYHRLVLVPTGPARARQWALQDVNSTQITTHPVMVREEDLEEWADADGVYITTTIALEHLRDTARARNALSSLSSRPVGRVNDVPGARSFVIADFAPVVVAMARQLKQLDIAAKKAPAAAAPEVQAEKRRLEQALVGSRTDVAAQYFLNGIRALDAK